MILDKEQALNNTINERVSNSFGGIKRKLASLVANHMISTEKFTEQFAQKISLMLTEKINEKGIDIQLNTKFLKSNFVVLEANILNLNCEKLLTFAKGEQFSNDFQQLQVLLKRMELNEPLEKMQNQIKQKVYQNLIDKLNMILPEKLYEKGFQIEVFVLPTHLQAEFFFEVIQSIK